MKGKRNKFSHSNSFLNYSGTENISNWHLDQASVDEILLSKFEQQHKNRMTAVKKKDTVKEKSEVLSRICKKSGYIRLQMNQMR